MLVGVALVSTGLVIPDSGPRYSALSLVRSPAKDDLTFLGSLVAGASPVLAFALVTLVPVSSHAFDPSDFVLLGWALVLIGAHERFGESLEVGFSEIH